MDVLASPVAGARVPRTGRRVPPVDLVLLVAALAVGVVVQGAYHRPIQAAVAVLLGLAGVAGLARRPRRLPPAAWPVVAGAAGLAVWAVARAGLAGSATAGVPMAGLALGVAAAVVLVGRADEGQRRVLTGALLALGVVAALTGWAGVAWRLFPVALQDQQLWRAAGTVTYANANAGLLAPLALLALGLLTGPRPPVDGAPAGGGWREGRVDPHAVVGAGACLLVTGLAATLSRGGAVAFLAGLAVLVAARGPRAVVRGSLGPLAGTGIALAGLAPSFLASGPPRPAAAVAGLVAGLAVTVAAGRRPRRALPALAALAAVALAGGAALGAFDGLLSAGAGTRLTFASSHRVSQTRAALDLVADRPLLGTGPGRAELIWTEPDGSALLARYVHNEYVQVLTELGLVGAALLALLLGAVARLVARGRGAGPGARWAGVAAGLAALGVHSALDFLWHLGAIPLVAAALAGLAAPREDRG